MRILLIDTCGEMGSLALAEDAQVLATAELPARSASSALLPEVRRLMLEAGWSFETLEVVGVVSGPGSFTGVRVGLAAAKGLCEARGLMLAAVSRLEVLAEVAALERGYAVLDAGRGEVYTRSVGSGENAQESLVAVSELIEAASGHVVIAEEKLGEVLGVLAPEMHRLHASAALPVVLRRVETGGDDLESADANYVRGEQQIYGKSRK